MCWSRVNKTCVGSTAKTKHIQFCLPPRRNIRNMYSLLSFWIVGPLAIYSHSLSSRERPASCCRRASLAQMIATDLNVRNCEDPFGFSLISEQLAFLDLRRFERTFHLHVTKLIQNGTECKIRESPFRQNSWKQSAPLWITKA